VTAPSGEWKTKKVFHSKSLGELQAGFFITSANCIVSGVHSSEKFRFRKAIF
jgi:hypothetical protein